MPIYHIKSTVVLFNHQEYGARLLFQQGKTNPRNMLGKIGITVHSQLGSWFYKTITIEARLVNEDGKFEEKAQFILNRSSLIKYIGEDASPEDSDEELIKKLNSKMLCPMSNNMEDKDKQSKAGEQLRHAGEHNQKKVRYSFMDSLLGNFLSWLYQITIVSLNRFKARFIFVRTEKDLFEAGETLAITRFHETYASVPAYQNHMKDHPIEDLTLGEIPITNKANYIKKQIQDSDTHLQGKYPSHAKIDTSTGTTGKPTSWVRSHHEVEVVKKTLELAEKIQFGDRKIAYINAFAFGPWATGLTTYELMRQTGSIFASGPDKEKILDELIRIRHYETHQLELEIDKLRKNKSNINEENGKVIAKFISDTLKAVLKKPRSVFADIFNQQVAQLTEPNKTLILSNLNEIRNIAKKLDQEQCQIILSGYPPFLKELVTYAQSKKLNLDDFSVIGIIGGQGNSEAMRDRLIEDGFNGIYSSYGASDLDINLGSEADDEIFIRKAIEKNPGLARELYGANKGLPMVFHYDPMNTHVECDETDELIFTSTREDRSSPRIRYDLGDKGRIYASSDVQALLSKYGMFRKLRSNFPLMFVWGRDATVVFNGANVDFTELERAVNNVDSAKCILKKAFYTYHDTQGNEKLEFWLELDENAAILDQEGIHECAKNLIATLVNANQDFRYQVDKLDPEAELPAVRFFKRGQSPISDAGGHRKQVLVFNQQNLPEGYKLPEDQELCRAVTLSKNELTQTVLKPM
jgi:phenylacetate-coenzyme A ligase PaaK-like adenylate-forming protein